MVASDNHPRTHPQEAAETLSASAVREHLEEEINRARRHETQLSCLLVRIDSLQEISSAPGSALPEQTLAYVGGALRRELRSFDRIGRLSDSELLIALPGADGPRAETVGRRVLDRLSTIKVEAEGMRRPLRISVGLAAWQGQFSGEDLLARTRAALRKVNGEDSSASVPAAPQGGAPPPVRRP